MIMTKGKVRFVRLRAEDLELVRQWRNSPRISQYMEYQEYITPEMQQEWFKSVHNKNNLYLIIEHDHQKIGLINAKNINWDDHSLEGGIFFWEEEVYNTPLPALVSLMFSELVVRAIRLKIYAHIMRTNDRAIRYNLQLGFELCPGQEDIENQLYLLTPENYLVRSAKLRKAFYILIDKSPYVLQMEKEDYVTGIGQMIDQRIDPSIPTEIRETDSGKEYYFDFS